MSHQIFWEAFGEELEKLSASYPKGYGRMPKNRAAGIAKQVREYKAATAPRPKLKLYQKAEQVAKLRGKFIGMKGGPAVKEKVGPSLKAKIEKAKGLKLPQMAAAKTQVVPGLGAKLQAQARKAKGKPLPPAVATGKVRGVPSPSMKAEQARKAGKLKPVGPAVQQTVKNQPLSAKINKMRSVKAAGPTPPSLWQRIKGTARKATKGIGSAAGTGAKVGLGVGLGTGALALALRKKNQEAEAS